jgi:hypothetical protein
MLKLLNAIKKAMETLSQHPMATQSEMKKLLSKKKLHHSLCNHKRVVFRSSNWMRKDTYIPLPIQGIYVNFG